MTTRERLAMTVLGGELGADFRLKHKDIREFTCLLDGSACKTADLASLYSRVSQTIVADGHGTSLTPSDTAHDFLGHRVFSASAPRSRQGRQPTRNDLSRERA